MSIKATYADVLAKVRELALEEGTTEPWRMINSVRSPLGLDFSSNGYHREYAKAEDTFKNQVRRALNALADDGTLMKTSAGRSNVVYRTPSEHARHLQEQADAQASRKAGQDRTAAQVSRLAAFGITAKVQFGEPSLGSDQLDHLMDLAAKGLDS
jgi:hypothetical protein